MALNITPSPAPTPPPSWWQDFIERGKVTGSESSKILGGWVSDIIIQAIKNIYLWFEPIINWGCRLIIIAAFIIYFTTKEKKYIAISLKWFFVFLLYYAIRSAI